MNEETKRALELARSLLWSAASNTYADRVQGIRAIDEALAAAPAAPRAPAGDVRPIHRECAMFDPHDRCDECRPAPAAPVAADTISIQEAWEAAGGNPGIKATKSELLDALRMLDKVCDEAPAAPVAQANQVKALENIRDDCMPDDLTPGEYACAVLNGYYAAPAAPVSQPVSNKDIIIDGLQIELAAHKDALAQAGRDLAALRSQPVSEPSDEDIKAVLKRLNDGLTGVRGWGWLEFARAVLALRPAAPRAPLTPRGFLLHWPKPGGGRTLLWHETDAAGVSIGCPVEPVYSYGVRANGIGQEGGAA